jgi:dihydrofolate reductase
MKLKLIVGVDNQNGIGLNNTLPWYNKEDLKYFSKVTKGDGNNVIVMGSNTWLSLPKRPLPKRLNVILSKKSNFNGENIKTLKEFNIELFKDYDEVWIIGGESVYKQFIDIVDEIHITKINGNYNCDTFFPKLSENLKLINNFKLNEISEVNIYSK